MNNEWSRAFSGVTNEAEGDKLRPITYKNDDQKINKII